jgi:hypothetical protein
MKPVNILHENVKHAVFGGGEIIAQSDSMVTVRFQDSNNEKKFLYPQAFDQYLKLTNPVLLPELESELRVLRIEASERQKKFEEMQQAERLAWKKINSATKTRKTTRTRTKK